MSSNALDICAQIRQDWADERFDNQQGKRCPGGYFIPANKTCGGAKEGQPQPGQRGYKRSAAKRVLKGAARGMQKGAEVGARAASGMSVGASIYGLGNKRTRARTTMEGYTLESGKKAAEAAASGGAIGALAGGVAGGVRTAAKEVSAYRKTMKARAGKS